MSSAALNLAYKKRVYKNKFQSRKVTAENGAVFDSVLEYNRYVFLLNKQNEGWIEDIKRQVTYELIPRQTVIEQRKGRYGQLLKPKEVAVEQACRYKADFVYTLLRDKDFNLLEEPKTIIEDTKGYITKEYIIKRKLMRFNGNPITEVKKYTQPIC